MPFRQMHSRWLGLHKVQKMVLVEGLVQEEELGQIRQPLGKMVVCTFRIVQLRRFRSPIGCILVHPKMHPRSSWGEQGYIRLVSETSGAGQCGMYKQPSYPMAGGSGPTPPPGPTPRC